MIEKRTREKTRETGNLVQGERERGKKKKICIGS